MKEYRELREQICDVCHKMWQKGWVAANDGNVSVRLEDGTFLATPTGMSKSFITPEKLVHIDKNGKVLDGEPGLRPSSEIKMHLRCYREREDVGAVLHAHPPVATGFAVANIPLDDYSMIETVISLGSVPVTPYGTPSTEEVPEAIAPYLADHDAMLLQNHGALVVGPDIIGAYYRMETLELFAQNGYLGTSMNDIAGQLGFTKAALYKHYASKQEILDKIVERMNKMDYERAEVYEMPETEPDGFAEAYLHTPIQKIRTYSLAQFDHWTKEPFSSNFRKMLTLEQYRDPKLAQLHHDYLAGGPLEYMAAIFRKLADSDEDAMQLALEFYGPMYLLYSVYDGAEKKESASSLLATHIDHFIAKVESDYRKKGRTT